MTIEELEKQQEELLTQLAEKKSNAQEKQNAGEVNFYTRNRETIQVLGAFFLSIIVGAISFYYGVEKYLYFVIALVLTFGVLRLFNVMVRLGEYYREMYRFETNKSRTAAMNARETHKQLKEIKDMVYLNATITREATKHQQNRPNNKNT